jgi:transposase-like protein
MGNLFTARVGNILTVPMGNVLTARVGKVLVIYNLNQSSPVGEVCRKLGISEQTYYRWRKEYGGMRVDQARRLEELEQENARLKKLVADLSLDNAILKEVNRGNFCARPREAGPSNMCVT